MEQLGLWTIKNAILKASNMPCPGSVPRTGARAKSVDCVSVTLSCEDSELWNFLVDGYDQRGAVGRFWNESSYSSEGTIPWRFIADYQFEATYFRGVHNFAFESAAEFLLSMFFKKPSLSVLRNRVAQFLFNKKTPVRKSRIDLLKHLIELRRQDAVSNDGIVRGQFNGHSAHSLLEILNGRRIFFHPNFRETLVDMQMNLGSLAQSGDVIENQLSYRATDSALTTIAVFEEENRRHADQVRQNNAISLLTLALVLVGILQAYITWMGGV